jgi:hypothetical protein
MGIQSVTLDDRFDLGKSTILMNGTQALVRLMLMQKARDRAAGLNTAGLVTGYRGSPLGAVDMQMTRARKHLEASDIVFQPGLNEDLAATALWGSQTAELRGEGKFDGVFGLWYGKGPGVDRTGDVFRHVNMAGTSQHGGVLVAMGDDHTGESSTTCHQSDWALVDAHAPVLSPAGVQEILDLGLYGLALSRFAGVWVGLKLMKDTVEATAVVDGRPDRMQIHLSGVRDAQGRAQHPVGRPLDRAGGTAPALQALRGGGLRGRQRHRPADAWQTRREDRFRRGGQELARPSLGARCARHRRGGGRTPRRHHLQGGPDMAARHEGVQGLGRGAGADRRRGGKAQADRGAGQGSDLRRPARAARLRLQGRAGRCPVPAALFARPHGNRAEARPYPDRGGARHRQDGGGHGPGGGGAPRQQRAGTGDAHALFLLGLSAQHLDQGARGRGRGRRHRLSLHGEMDGPLDRGLYPYGRRGRQLDRRGAVFEAQARLPEPRRGHLQPFRHPRHPRRRRRQGQHHLQDPLQRRRRHDRRAA